MDELRLRFLDGQRPDLPVQAGMLSLGRGPDGLAPVDQDQSWLLHLFHDRRGLWLNVAREARGVHVNGRPVQQIALLRAGDSIHVDGEELLLFGMPDAPRAPAAAARDATANLRLALRGVGGPHHGRSLSLERARTIGCGAKADIRIDGPGIAERHASIEARHGLARLQAHGDSEVLLNGVAVREAMLRPGDQIAFGAGHRFVLEGPPPAPAATLPPGDEEETPEDEVAGVNTARKPALRLPWLLLAAALLAASLAGLLLFGAS